MPITTCVFDAYGTLFDVNAAAAQAADDPDFPRLADLWPAVARDWRRKQLEYTWLRAVADRHCDFWQVTQDGLDWALAAQGLEDPALRARLLALYRQLPTYAEVPAMLAALKARGLTTAILSNGSPDMLNAAVASAGIAPLRVRWAVATMKRSMARPSRSKRSMSKTCSAELRAPVSIFALISDTPRSGRPTHSRQPTMRGGGSMTLLFFFFVRPGASLMRGHCTAKRRAVRISALCPADSSAADAA